jgi:hypothetical protein
VFNLLLSIKSYLAKSRQQWLQCLELSLSGLIFSIDTQVAVKKCLEMIEPEGTTVGSVPGEFINRTY